MDKKRTIRDFNHRINPLHEEERIRLIKSIAMDLKVNIGENTYINDIKIDFLNELGQYEFLDKLEILYDVLDKLDPYLMEVIVDDLSKREDF